VRWFIDHVFVVVPAQAIVAQHLQSFQQTSKTTSNPPGSTRVKSSR